MTDLSIVAERVINSAYRVSGASKGSPIAAALRAVADELVPEECKPNTSSDHILHHYPMFYFSYLERKNTRSQMLALADELEAL